MNYFLIFIVNSIIDYDFEEIEEQAKIIFDEPVQKPNLVKKIINYLADKLIKISTNY